MEHQSKASDDARRTARTVLDAAHALFLVQGYDATSMDAVARAAGVSKRTPYIYFTSKHELFSAIILRIIAELDQFMEPRWLDKHGSEAVAAGMQAYGHFALQDPQRFNLLMTFERRDFYPGKQVGKAENAAACQTANDRLTNRLIAIIAQAQEAGDFSLDYTAAQSALLVWSSFTGVLTIALDRKDVLETTYKWSPEQMIAASTAKILQPFL